MGNFYSVQNIKLCFPRRQALHFNEICRDLPDQKTADGWTAFQLYIVEDNMGTCALPDMYALSPEALGLLAYISGKAPVPMLSLLHKE